MKDNISSSIEENGTVSRAPLSVLFAVLLCIYIKESFSYSSDSVKTSRSIDLIGKILTEKEEN